MPVTWPRWKARYKFVALFLLGAVPLDGMGSLVPLQSHYLSPVSEIPSATFYLTDDQCKQAWHLLEILDVAIPFLEEVEKGAKRGRGDWEAFEDLPSSASPAKTLLDESFESYEGLFVLGSANLKRFKDRLHQALQGKAPLPRRETITLPLPLGLNLFSCLTHSMEGKSVIGRLELNRFGYLNGPLPQLKEPILIPGYGTGSYNLEGKEAFTLLGKTANAVAKKVFPETDSALICFRDILFERHFQAREFASTIHQLLEVIPNTTIENSQSLRQKVLEASGTMLSAEEVQTLEEKLKREKDEKLEVFLISLKNKIFEREKVLEFERGGQGTIHYFCLPALLNERRTNKVMLAVVEMEIDWPAFLNWAQDLLPAEQIANQILFDLHEILGLRLDGKVPGLAEHASSPEGMLSQIAAHFSPVLLREDSVFSGLLKIWTLLEKVETYFNPKSPKSHFEVGLEVRQNIFEALRRANPTWFADSLKLLDNVAAYEGEVDFLEATGWVDSSVSDLLVRSPRDRRLIQEAKDLLSRGIVVDDETLSLSPQSRTYLGRMAQERSLKKNLSLKNPINRSAVFQFLKNQIYRGNEPLSEMTAYLAFLKREQFEEMAKPFETVEGFERQLAWHLSYQKMKERLKAIYAYANRTHKNPIRAAWAFKELVWLNGLVFKWNPLLNVDGLQKNLHWMLHLMRSFLSAQEVYDFFRGLVYYLYFDSTREELNQISGFLCTRLERRLAEEKGWLSKLSRLMQTEEDKAKERECNRYYSKSAVTSIMEGLNEASATLESRFANLFQNNLSASSLESLSREKVQGFLKLLRKKLREEPLGESFCLKYKIDEMIDQAEAEAAETRHTRQQVSAFFVASVNLYYKLFTMSELKKNSIFKIPPIFQVDSHSDLAPHQYYREMELFFNGGVEQSL